jgi:mannitol 2-dehydrogenase
MLLTRQTLSQIQLPNIAHTLPQYLNTQRATGIVHIGVGGFHRAHQAIYTHHLLNQQPDNIAWGTVGVGLLAIDKNMQQVMHQQQNLYSVMELAETGLSQLHIVGVHDHYYFAPEDFIALHTQLMSPDVKIISFTITEGGYLLDDASGQFLFDHPPVQADLQQLNAQPQPHAWQTVFGYLAYALQQRRAQKLPGLTLMSCDNVAMNGQVLRRALQAFVSAWDPTLNQWIDDHISFPSSMVDCITPRTEAQHRQLLQQQTGIDDQWPVVCEPFRQWVLEDDFCQSRPQWQAVGVQFVADVAPYETMKMRLLNASHSALGYLGMLLGYERVDQAMQDAVLVQWIRQFMQHAVLPTLPAVPGVDLANYCDTLLTRFANPAIGDRLARLCAEGASKIPKFVLPTLKDLVQQQLPTQPVILILASWALYLRHAETANATWPIEEQQMQLVTRAQQANTANIWQALLETLLEPALYTNPNLKNQFDVGYAQLLKQGVRAALSEK